jgi:membrane protease subunit HflC
MNQSKLLVVAAALLVLFVLFGSVFQIDETQQAIILQFGKPVGKSIKDAGLHFKLPFIQDVKRFEKRILEWDGSANQIPTSDKKYIWVDTFGRWRIIDPLKFYQAVRSGDERQAQSRLDDIIDSATRNYIRENLLIEAVRNSNRELPLNLEDSGGIEAESVVPKIEKGRDAITDQILEKAGQAMPEFGIELLDVRIKRVNYIEEVRQKVYERMIAERRRIADKFRSEGQGRKAEIDGEREKEFQRITSEAYRKSQIVKGEADAKATSVYANAFSRDPEFYSFLRTLESYKSTIDSNATLMLNTNSEYLKYLKKLK